MRRVQFSILTSTPPPAGEKPQDILVNFLPTWEARRAAYCKMLVRKLAQGQYKITLSFVPTEGMNYDMLYGSDVVSELLINDGLVTIAL